MHVHGEKSRKNTSEDTLDSKPTEVPKGIAEAAEAETARLSRDVGLLLPSEEGKLDDLDLDFLELNSDSEMQASAMLEGEGDTLMLKKSFNH